ncbi:FAD dependent oxidoreductase [Mycena pura]|uniref:FAD dependent oxidoreductase n=1 Tax=Mycena pura TaxID=153505 RepID=A0AAD6VEJ5_9AGAR|nr:FAD dependent oxidoreductase [Mycena pura]
MSVSDVGPFEFGQLEHSRNVFEVENRSKGPASLPVPNPSRSFWIDSPNANPLAEEGSNGPLTDDADVCIIGSGITGVSAAYHLSVAAQRGELPRVAERPWRVVILEARDFCRNGGHLSPRVFMDFRGYQSKYGTDQAMRAFEMENRTTAELVKIIRGQGWAGTVDLVEGGHTSLFLTPNEQADLKADFEAAKAAGIELKDVRWLTEEETQIKYGVPYPAVELAGFNLWPLKFITELYMLAKQNGHGNLELNLHTRTPVTSISRSSNPRRWAAHTPRGVVNCSYVIHATNAYASHLLPHLAGPDGIIPTRGQVVATRASVPAEQLFKCSWDANEGFEYWFARPVAGDEKPLVILGGGREVQRPDFEYYQTDDSVVNPLVGASLRRFLPSVFPGKFAEGVQPESEWTGIMGFTKSTDPMVGPVIDKADPDGGKFKGQYISAGYSGHGMPRAFPCAAVVASMLAADASGVPFRVPNWFPEAFLTSDSLAVADV